MKTNVIPQLILKDWRLQSRTITLLTLAGVAALAFLPDWGQSDRSRHCLLLCSDDLLRVPSSRSKHRK